MSGSRWLCSHQDEPEGSGLELDIISPWQEECQKMLGCHLCSLVAESLSLWTGHRWWNSSPGEWGLRPWPAGGDWAGQLPSNHRCVPGTLEELSQPWADRALWLPANHTGWNQETQGKAALLLSPHLSSSCLACSFFFSDLESRDFFVLFNFLEYLVKKEKLTT